MISELLEHSDEGSLSLYLADNASRILFLIWLESSSSSQHYYIVSASCLICVYAVVRTELKADSFVKKATKPE